MPYLVSIVNEYCIKHVENQIEEGNDTNKSSLNPYAASLQESISSIFSNDYLFPTVYLIFELESQRLSSKYYLKITFKDRNDL